MKKNRLFFFSFDFLESIALPPLTTRGRPPQVNASKSTGGHSLGDSIVLNVVKCAQVFTWGTSFMLKERNTHLKVMRVMNER